MRAVRSQVPASTWDNPLSGISSQSQKLAGYGILAYWHIGIFACTLGYLGTFVGKSAVGLRGGGVSQTLCPTLDCFLCTQSTDENQHEPWLDCMASSLGIWREGFEMLAWRRLGGRQRQVSNFFWMDCFLDQRSLERPRWVVECILCLYVNIFHGEVVPRNIWIWILWFVHLKTRLCNALWIWSKPIKVN